LRPLRQMRDDEQTSSAIRWTTANQLREYATEDRAAGARVLQSLAADTTNRPALRWRSARDLATFGTRGHQLGAAALHAFAHDEAVSPHIRVKAARALARWSELCRADARALFLKLASQEREAAQTRP